MNAYLHADYSQRTCKGNDYFGISLSPHQTKDELCTGIN